jgi:hypothetical protein
MIVMFAVPQDLAGVSSIEIKRGSVVVHESSTGRTLHTPATPFL